MKLSFFLKTLSKQYLANAFVVGAVVALLGILISNLENRQYSSKAVVTLESGDELPSASSGEVIKTRLLDREYLLSLASDPKAELHLSWWLKNSVSLSDYLSLSGDSKASGANIIKEILAKNVTFMPEGRNRLAVKVSISDKRLAPTLANAIARAIVQQAEESSADAKEELISRLEAKVQASRQEVKLTEDKIAQSTDGKIDWAKLQISNEQLATLGHSLSRISVEKAELSAALADPESALASQAEFLHLEEKQLALLSELESLTSILGVKHPRIIELGQELDTLERHISSKEKTIRKSLEILLSAKNKQQESIEQAIYALHERQLSLSSAAESYEALREHRISLKKATNWWNKQLAYSKTNISSQSRNYYLSVPARLTTTSQKFTSVFLAGVALLASLLYLLWGAISLAFSRKFHSLNYAEEILSDEIVGTIPTLQSISSKLSEQSSARKLLPTQNNFLEANTSDKVTETEAIDCLSDDNVILLRPEMILDHSPVHIQLPFLDGQPNLSFEAEDKHLRRALRELRAEVLTNLDESTRSICVSSAHRKEGRSLVADGLALSLANAGYRTLLLNADLSKLSTNYQRPGLAEFLQNNACMSDILCQSEIPRLYLIGSGNVEEHSVDLLVSKTMQSFIGSLGQLFDFVVLDSPALAENREALRLCETADASLFVIDQEQSDVESSRRYLSKVKNISSKLIGIAFNRVNSKSSYFEHKAA